MLKVFTKKRFWKKLCTVLLCLVLCFTLVVNTCVDSFAIAGVDDGLFLLLLAILTASGITFSSVANAHIGTDAFYNNCDSPLQSFLNSKAQEISLNAALDMGFIGLVISANAEYWPKVIDAIAKTFGDFKGITAHLNIDSPGMLKLDGDAFNFSVPVVGPSFAVSVSVGNVTMQYIGGKSQAIESIKPLIASRNIAFVDSHVYTVMSTKITGLTFVADYGYFSHDGITVNDTFSYVTSATAYPFPVLQGKIFNFSTDGMLNGNRFVLRNEDRKARTFTLNYIDATTYATGANIVVGNKLGDYTLSDSICPDGIWTRKSYADWLNDLLFGEGAGAASDIPSVGALPGNPGIDTTAYPGNDTWHDGSINDDVATGNPSIGISIPTDITDETITDYTPDVARDIASADKVLDDTSTGDNDKPGDKDDDKKPSSKPSGLPSMTLPEILFKNKFPFCLPWDLYSLFVSLNATPKAPKFTIPFKNERLNIDYEITIDISDYEMFAKLSRASLSVVFVVALILLSRKLIGAE
ncbi:hypothetical protein ACTQ3M_08875 [Oscillospiraceae bacterium LCP25S3_E10]